ncbi:hypothetical protein RJ641_031470 [Dillenia turbinata]|uniref:DUF6821 domain-containing protein n=1 Tax=Dillenia turbinata TaxID=194707 RepID=A0AAN8W2M9_9MAGN
MEELHDWEMLQNSDKLSESSDNSNSGELEDIIEGESQGMVRSNYFSLDSLDRYAKPSEYVSEEGSVESDNPSWIDPGSDNQFANKNSAELWSDSASDRSDAHKSGEEIAKSEVGFKGIGEINTQSKGLGDFLSDSGGIFRNGSGSELIGEEKGENDLITMEQETGGVKEKENNVVSEDVKKLAANGAGDGEKRRVVWWKVPLEFLRFCVFRVNPVWSFSVAAAVMGFLILGRRLYKMKRKTQSSQLKVTMDDKKISQFMSRAARLNEAFSVVRRVPVIRPALPATTGVTPWPMMSLR